ncbi:MAG TPA: ATP-binding protein [Opitutaceae bacterium]|nr:ATP-binding protein [Opitutaceae bacterium]
MSDFTTIDEGEASPLVLVVDDERTSRLIAVKVIEDAGLRAEEAGDGESALLAFGLTQHDVVLLDVMMPGIDGFEVCQRLRKLPGGATTPVLIMTGLTDTASIERAYECGATDFITKPINWPVLGHRLRYMLRAGRAENALRQRNDELKQSNAELQDTRDQLLQSEKMASIGQLAAGVAHEINNPIGYVKSNFGSLDTYLSQMFELIRIYRDEEAFIVDPAALARISAARQSVDLEFLSEDVFALLKESREGISRVGKIVQDLKDFSRVGAGDEWGWADLHEGLETTINIVNNEIKYKAQLVKEYGELPEIECLPSQLNQVFMNLLVNAAHAIETQGTITIRSGVQGGEIWIEVSDTGKGIAPEHLNRIFDPFFTTKLVGKGTGLGLALSHGIVQKHHGRIEVQSEVGHGTTFRVCLPVNQKAVPAAATESQS